MRMFNSVCVFSGFVRGEEGCTPDLMCFKPVFEDGAMLTVVSLKKNTTKHFSLASRIGTTNNDLLLVTEQTMPFH